MVYYWKITIRICWSVIGVPGKCWRGRAGWRCSGTWWRWVRRLRWCADGRPGPAGPAESSSSAERLGIPRHADADSRCCSRWCSEPPHRETRAQTPRNASEINQSFNSFALNHTLPFRQLTLYHTSTKYNYMLYHVLIPNILQNMCSAEERHSYRSEFEDE